MQIEDRFRLKLEELSKQNNLRHIAKNKPKGAWVYSPEGKAMLNLCSNDYLGLAADKELLATFYQDCADKSLPLGSTGSRLMGGNYEELDILESKLAKAYGKEAALVAGTGFQLNAGLVSSLAAEETVILADRYIHASLIDGIKLSKAPFQRFRHNDMQQLQTMLCKYSKQYKQILIIVESLYSMDGDLCKLKELVALKQQYPEQVLLYVDEAHAIGVRGHLGLGLAEELGLIQEIDFLVGTFGKAYAAMGAFVLCKHLYRDYLINQLRPFIFSTSISPIITHWLCFILDRMPSMLPLRQQLASLQELFGSALSEQGINIATESQIIPLIVGDEGRALAFAEELRRRGYFALAIRYPTVEMGKARLRLSFRSDFHPTQISALAEQIALLAQDFKLLS